MMSRGGGRMNPGADEFQFAAMQQQPFVGFEQGMMVSAAGGALQHHMYDSLDFAAAATLQFQQQQQQQQGEMPSLLPTMPMPMPMHHGDVLYPSLGMVKREGEAGRMGLNLGRRTYFDMMAVNRLLMRSRLGGVFGIGGARPPRCQAEGCKADLSGAKHYHRRHKVCEFHAKASLVAAGGKQQRFCQQCSRFHVLTEFDEAKRSCRKRLAEHNRRRRKPAALTSSASNPPPPCKKLNTTSSSSYTAAKSTISSNTSAVSCQQQQIDQSKMAAVAVAVTARPTALTLGAPPPEEEDQLTTMLQAQAAAGNHHHHQQHFITSLLQNNSSGNISSVCSSGLPSTANNGEVSDLNNNGSNSNMHLFEVDFM